MRKEMREDRSLNGARIQELGVRLVELVREIVREEMQIKDAKMLTPGDYRVQANLTPGQLGKATIGRGWDLSEAEVYAIEGGRFKRIHDKRIEYKIRAIAETLGVDHITYRQAVRAQQERYLRERAEKQQRKKAERAKPGE